MAAVADTASLGTGVLPAASNKTQRKCLTKTSHLYLLPGETELFSTTAEEGFCCCKQERSIVITDQRVMFLWRQWLGGMSLASNEEAFYLDDLQFVQLVRLMSWFWVWIALVCIILGACLLGAADQLKGNNDKSSSHSSDFGRYYSSSSDLYGSYTNQAYGICLGVGLAFLFVRIAALITFIVRHLRRGVNLSLNFSRNGVGILDWRLNSWWRPKMSSTRRVILLDKEVAQTAYNTLAGLLHAKFSMKTAAGPRDSADSMA